MNAMSINIILGAVVAALAVIVAMTMLRKKNKFYFRIRQMTGTKRLIRDVIGYEVKNEKHVKYVYLKKLKELVPMPPEDAVDLSFTGKKVVEVYRDENGNYAYIRDNGPVKFFNPIDTEMQVLVAEQIQKANEKTENWIKKNALMLVGAGMCVMIVVAAMLFIGEPLKMANQYRVDAKNDRVQVLQIQESIAKIESNTQDIKGAVGIPDNVQAPN